MVNQVFAKPARFCGFIVVSGLVTFPSVALTEPAVFSVSLDSRYTDNARQSRVNEESDLESRVFLGVRHTSDPGRCNSDLGARVGYGYWLDETFDPENTASVDFEGDCRLATSLVWQASDYLRDVVVDSRATDTPNNRTRKNVFRTGPVLTLRLGSVDQFSFAAEYENTEFDEPEQTDGERYTGTVGWEHFFSQSMSGGLSVSVDQSRLDTEEEIDRVIVSVPFQKNWAATNVSGAIGYSQIETTFINDERENDGFIGNVLFVREINPTALVTLEASRELTDQTSDFDIRFEEFIFNLEQTSAVEVSAIRLALTKRFSNGSLFSTTVFGNRSDYLDIGTDEERKGINLDLRRPITGQLTATIGGGYDRRSYSEDNSEDEIARADAGIDFQLNRQLNIVSRIGYEQRKSDVVAREFDEAWVLVGLDYQFR